MTRKSVTFILFSNIARYFTFRILFYNNKKCITYSLLKKINKNKNKYYQSWNSRNLNVDLSTAIIRISNKY